MTYLTQHLAKIPRRNYLTHISISISFLLLPLLCFAIPFYRAGCTFKMSGFRNFFDQAVKKAENFAHQHNIPTQFPGQGSWQEQQHPQQYSQNYNYPPQQQYSQGYSYAPPQQHSQGFSNAPPIPPNKPTSAPQPAPQPYHQFYFQPGRPVSEQFKHQLGGGGWGNNELQNYTNDDTNSFHTQDSKLVLRGLAQNGQYTSARLTSWQTLGKQKGSLIAVASPPCARGIWPALWLLPNEPFQWPNEGEFDILETWNADCVNHSCLHWGHFNAQDWNKHNVIETHIGDMGSGRPLTYELAWEQDESAGRNTGGGRAVWYIDGRAVLKTTIPPGTRRMSDWQIIMNVAMGGNVCQGVLPANGHYDLVVHELKLLDQPTGGWDRFEADWQNAPEGHH